MNRRGYVLATRSADIDDHLAELEAGYAASGEHTIRSYYTLTDENWPLIGEMDAEGAFVVGAMSGFGSMAACAGGELCARWVLGTDDKPAYAFELSPQRYRDRALMARIGAARCLGFHRGLESFPHTTR